MKLPGEATLVRVFVGESDHRGRVPLYEHIVRKARELGVAGATVLRGVMGYGAHSRLHTAKLLRLSEDLPVVVELVDTEDNLRPLLEYLDETVEEGLITMEKVQVIRYRAKGRQAGPGA